MIVPLRKKDGRGGGNGGGGPDGFRFGGFRLNIGLIVMRFVVGRTVVLVCCLRV